MSNFLLPTSARAQSISVPFGQAAHFGLLSGGAVTTDGTAVGVWGKGGAAGSITSHVSATDSLLANSAGSVGGALADVQAAITYCQSLTAQNTSLFVLPKPTPGGVYQFSGSVTLDSTSTVHLQGNASTWHIFRINGSLTVREAVAVTLDDQIRPEHVVWQVSGQFSQEARASLPGIVLVGGSATVTNIQFGAQTLWALGNLYFSEQDPTVGRWAYAAPQWLGGNPSGPLASCVPDRTCDSERGRNNLANGSAEHFDPPFTGRISNMQLGSSNVNCWEAAVGGTVMTPDYFNADAPPPTPADLPTSTAIPRNAFGWQVPRTPADRAYMGFYAAARRFNTRYYQDYIRQPFAPDHRLEADRWYYGEFYVSRANLSMLPVPVEPFVPTRTRRDMLGMYLAEEVPPARWFDNGASNQSARMRQVPVGGSYNLSPFVVPQIQWAESDLTDTTHWVRVAGCFQATGRERCAVIGSYQSWEDPSSQDDLGAYYYLDDISLSAFPKPFIDTKEVRCGELVTFGALDCLLPLSSGAEYQWESDGAPASAWLPTPDYAMAPTQSAQYWLNIRVPVPGVPGTFQTTRLPAGEVEVALPTCQYDCQANVAQPLDLLYPDYKIPGGTTLPAHSVFYVNQNLKLTGGTVTIPEGTMLLMAPNTRIELENATLQVIGGTITAACFDLGLWNDIYVADANSGVQTAASANNRRAEISGMSTGINLNVGPTASGWFDLADTRFLHNQHTLSSQLPLTATAPIGSIQNCSFDAEPSLIGSYAPEWHVRLSGTRTQTVISNCTFERAAFGLFAPAPLRIGTPANTSFRANTFRSIYLAGIYIAAPGSTATPNALHLEENTFEMPTIGNVSIEVDMPPALALVEAVNPGQRFRFNQPSTYGVFTENVTLTMTRNTFQQPTAYADYDYLSVRTRQVGAYVQSAPDAIIKTNDFVHLHEGLVGLYAPDSFVEDNLFDDCKIGVHVLAAPLGVTANKVCLDCNSFMRYFGPGPNSLYGASYGVVVDAAAKLSLERFLITSTSASDKVLGNLFSHSDLWVKQNAPYTAPLEIPEFVGFNNAIVNNQPQPLEYLTYDDDEPNYDPANYNVLLAHAPAAVLKYWPGNNNYYGSTNVTVTTPNSPSQPQPSPFQVTSANDCASRGLGFTRGLMDRPASTGGVTSSTGKAREAVAVITCFPNPVEDHTTVRYTLPRSGQNARLEVRDLMGRIVLTQALDAQATTGETPLSLMTAPDGILICQLVVDGTVRASQRLAHGTTSSR